MKPAPLVTAIVCTRGGSEFLPRAVASVLGQSMDDFELVIVLDNEAGTPEESVLVDPRVRWVRTETRGVGAARAKGLSTALGTYVAYCDDDDVWLPQHLRRLLDVLEEEPELDLAYGDSEWVHEGRATDVPYSFDFDPFTLAGKNYIFASDVLHRAVAGRAVGGFDITLQASEDWDLWLRMARAGGMRHVPELLGTHGWHDGSVRAGGRHPDQMRVAARQPDDPTTAVPVPFQPATWTAARRELIWYSLLKAHVGYGRVARELMVALAQEGVDITMASTFPRVGIEPGWERFFKPWDHWGRIGFYYHYELRPDRMRCERLVNYSMWESTELPPDRALRINARVALQYVPCRQNVESHLAAGVTVPLKVLHHGVDGARFPILDRIDHQQFTFGSFGDLQARKGIDVLIRAFCEEFRPNEPVRLCLKDSAREPIFHCDDPRVEFIRQGLSHEQLLEFLRGLDAFVLPSRGEGFGLCGIEAMATGLPLVATAWSGPLEYLDPSDSYPLSFRLVDPQSNEVHRREPGSTRFHGLWAEPDHGHLRALLRHLYEHPAEASARGLLAAQRVRRDFRWDTIARQMLGDLDELAGLREGAT